MIIRILIALASGMIAAGLAGCGTSSPNSGNWLNSSRPPVAVGGVSEIRVDSRPVGAMIAVDGVQSGTSPVLIRLELDAAGKLITPIEISADYSISNPIRGVSHVVFVRYRRGDAPPRQLVLARPAEGGIQGLGSFVPGM